MVNHTEGTNLAIAAACGRVGFNSVNDRPRPSSMGVEEFAYMLEAKPRSYINLGNGPTFHCTTRRMTSTTNPCPIASAIG